jgi:hypothetical protein
MGSSSYTIIFLEPKYYFVKNEGLHTIFFNFQRPLPLFAWSEFA